MPTLLEKIQAHAAARLVLPPKTSPRQELARYKNFLKVETHRLKILHRAGGEGREICRARSAIIDLVLRYILEGVKNASPLLARTPWPVFALVAIGGYGRAELNPHSDIDIMFLHESDMVVRGQGPPGAGRAGRWPALHACGTWGSKSATRCVRSMIASRWPTATCNPKPR